MDSQLLGMRSVTKRFGATAALREVSLDVQAGSVHALIGENGAGKSTLMKILAGVHRPDSGTMLLAGQPYSPSSPLAARRAGIAMIHQELTLAPHLSVEANLLLGVERRRWGWLRGARNRQIARQALARLSQGDLPLDAIAAEVSPAVQQLVEIARALVCDARVLVFDEPTSSLTQQDATHLFAVIRELRAQGLGIVYISHFLEEVAQIADRYTVLRDGEVVDCGALADVTLDRLVCAMVGRELNQFFPRVPHQGGQPLLEIRGLSGVRAPRDVNLIVHRGEIVGLAGLIGAGRSELLRCIFGLDEVVRGEVRVARSGPLCGGVRSRIEQRLGLVSEDRKAEGLAAELSIVDNLTLTRMEPFSRWGWLNLRRRDAAAASWLRAMRVRATGPQQRVGELSGGNQQKIAIARLLHQDADLLLLDEPTRGVDIGTKAEIYRLIGELAAQGKAVVMVSSYLPELLNVCDRVGVMCRGRLREVRSAGSWTEEQIMHAATGRE